MGGAAHRLPGGVVVVELHDGVEPVLRFAGHPHLTAMAQAGGLGGGGAEHLGQAMGGGRHHLALHPSTRSQGSHEQAMAVVHGGGVGHPAVQHHPRVLAPGAGEVARQPTAVHVEGELGQALAQGGPELGQEEAHRIAVGGVVVAAEKGEALAAGEGGRLIGALHHPGAEGGGGGAEGFRFDHGTLHLAVAEGEIHQPDHLQLLALHGLHRLQGAAGGIALELLAAGGTQLAQVVEIGVAEQQARLGGVATQERHHLLGHGVAGDVHGIELSAALADGLLKREHKGGMEHLHATALEGFGVAGQPGEVGGQEGGFVAEALHQLQFHQGGVAAGIAIGAGGVVVDEQHPAADAAVFDALGLLVGGFGGADEGLRPLALEQGAVDLLVLLEAFGGFGVAAVAEALVVNHAGLGGVAHPVAGLAHLEGEVGVFVVGRGELGAEATHLAPELGADHQSRCADVIHFTAIGKGRLEGIAGAAVVPRRSIPPHDAARLLQAAIGQHQLGPHDARIGPVLKRKQQLFEPAGAGFGVVVEQHQIGGAGLGSTAAAGLVEAAGEGMAHHAHRWGFGGEGGGCVVEGAVVDDDHLKGDAGGGIGQGRQAAAGDGVLPVHRNHHRHQRLSSAGQLQGLAGAGAAIGARLLARGQGQASGIVIEAHRMAEEPLQQRQIRRQGGAVGISPVQPGAQAAQVLPGEWREVIGEGGTGVGQQGRPGGELRGNQIEAFIELDPGALAVLLLEAEVVDCSIAQIRRQGQLQRPLVRGKGIRRSDR